MKEPSLNPEANFSRWLEARTTAAAMGLPKEVAALQYERIERRDLERLRAFSSMAADEVRAGFLDGSGLR